MWSTLQKDRLYSLIFHFNSNTNSPKPKKRQKRKRGPFALSDSEVFDYLSLKYGIKPTPSVSIAFIP